MPKPNQTLEINYREFAGQREDEEVVMVLYKHWYTLVAPIVGSLLVIVVSFIIPIWLGIMTFIFRYGFSAGIYYLWLAGWVINIIHYYHIWNRQHYIVTTDRVISIHQKNAINRDVSEMELDKVQSLTQSMHGPAATMFNFGDITLISAGGLEVKLREIAYPAEVQEEITRLIKSAGKKQASNKNIADFIEQHRT